MCFSSAHYACALYRFYACAVTSTAICDWTQKKKNKSNLYLGRFLRKARVIVWKIKLAIELSKSRHTCRIVYHIVFEKPPWGKIIKDVCICMYVWHHRRSCIQKTIGLVQVLIRSFTGEMSSTHGCGQTSRSLIFRSLLKAGKWKNMMHFH